MHGMWAHTHTCQTDVPRYSWKCEWR